MDPNQPNPYATTGGSAHPVGAWATAQILPPSPPPPARRRRSIAAIVAGAVGVAAVGVGATVALGALGGGGEQADVVLPANAVLAATFDLDPSASQKIDALRFARKFPQTSGLDWDSGTTPRKWLYEKLTADADAAPSWAEVEPWLGDRAGIAVLPPDPGESQPNAVLALQVTDQEQARVTLSALRSGQGPLSGLAGEGDWVVLAETDAAAAQALASAQTVSLAQSPTYSGDIADLGDKGVASVWVDYSRVRTLTSMMPLDGAAAAAQRVPVKGHGAATLRFTGADLEIVGSVRGQDPTTLPSASPVRVAAPGDAAAVLSVSGLGDLVVSQWSQLLQTAWSGASSGAEVAQVEKATGLKLPEDLGTLLGRQTTLVVGADGTAPGVGLKVVSDSPGLGAAFGRLEKALAEVPSARPQRTADGYVVTFGAPVPGLVDGDGLASAAAFRGAVPDADTAQVVGYLDVARLMPLVPSTSQANRADLEPIRALGISASRDGDDSSRFRIKLTTR